MEEGRERNDYMLSLPFFFFPPPPPPTPPRQLFFGVFPGHSFASSPLSESMEQVRSYSTYLFLLFDYRIQLSCLRLFVPA